MSDHQGGRDPMSAPRYMDIATFMRLPLIVDPADYDVALLGLPYDGAVTNRPGARHGPHHGAIAQLGMLQCPARGI